VRAHVADVAARVPGATLVLQLDEPSLPAALAGRLATPSGYGTVRAVEAGPAEDALREVLAGAQHRVVHCCAPDAPLELLRRAGATALSVDVTLLGERGYDALGEAVDAGVSLWLGVVATDSEPTLRGAREPIRRLWRDLGFAAELLATSVVPTPACGLAGSSPDRVRRVLAVLRECGAWLTDPDDRPEER
jgi:hypothetical protein